MRVFVGYVGIFNPFWLLAWIMHGFGLSFGYAFLLSITFYYLLGQFAFYLLAKEILRDRTTAYLAFLLFFFSSFSSQVYTQYHTTLIFVPAVWFFYFGIRLIKTWRPAFLLGTGCALIIILTSYLPFYFVTVFMFLALPAAIIYHQDIPPFIRNFKKFLKTYPVAVALSGLAVLLALTPGYLAYRDTAQKKIVAPFRQSGSSATTLEKGVVFDNYKNFTDGSVTSRMSFPELYSDYDQVIFGNDGYFYVSFFALLLFLLGIMNPLSKKIAVLFIFSFLLLMLTLENTTPFHFWLFTAIPFFKIMRNMHFFLPFLTAAFILLCTEHLRVFLNNLPTARKQRHFTFSWILFVHAAAFLFLIKQPLVPAVSLVTLVLSLLLFSFLTYRRNPLPPKILLAAVCAVALLHPLQVLGTYLSRKNFDPQMHACLNAPQKKAEFSFRRYEENHPIQWYSAFMIDAPVLEEHRDSFSSFWSFALNKNLSARTVKAFTANKFYLYSRLDLLPEHDTPWEKIYYAMDSFSDIALVNVPDPGNPPEGLRRLHKSILPGNRAVIIGPDSAGLQVTGFTVNSLEFKTDLARDLFLVYTDSFDTDWKAFINGKPAAIYRAQGAFKGLVLPAGKNTVMLKFDPAFGAWFYLGLIIFFYAFFGISVFVFLSRKTKKPRHEKK